MIFTSWARSLLLNPKPLSSLQINPGWERFPSSSERLGSHVRQMLQSLGGKKNRELTKGVWPKHSQMYGTSFWKSGRRSEISRKNPSENQVIIIFYWMPQWSFWFRDKNEHFANISYSCISQIWTLNPIWLDGAHRKHGSHNWSWPSCNDHNLISEAVWQVAS